MTGDELTELIKKLVAKGIVVIVLGAAPSLQTDAPAAPSTPDQVTSPAAPQVRIPETTAPRETAPETAAPGGTAPKNTAPRNSTGPKDATDPKRSTPERPQVTLVPGTGQEQRKGGATDTPERGEKKSTPAPGGGTGAPQAPSGHGTESGTGTKQDTSGTTGGTGSGGAAMTGSTAAERHGWGTATHVDDFSTGTANWNIYDGPGHAGNGRRTPDAVGVVDGALRITGDGSGNTAGMAWVGASQKYGRWEGRVRAPKSDPSYNALLLLWPTAEDWPSGGELDFMEMMDPHRQRTNAFFHYGADNSQVEGSVEVDATEWHNWALEWTPEKITAFVDGEPWFSTTDPKVQPPGPMHLCIQLDWFPEGGSPQESMMEVAWVRQYALDGTPTAQA
ncbi:glycoside hydrolase family 16 protein [Pseudonocardia phyllosphaerae]|uniref:glycoside hydrolase family 16 protein n=1 Tax=Pseudonocardia phyllosphaerae TaxID=3390502 RepID=UPI00397D7600